MKVVAIISEYNPFHNGHKYQIDKIRENLGDDTAIIAIMSGNYTQRGESAIADKTVRAKAACDGGVNLVLELPFPFCSSSAEFFASSGVRIADRLSIVDYLAFGSECGDISKLSDIADILCSEEFILHFDTISKEPKNKSLGYPKLCESAVNTIYGDKLNNFFTPNNILAIEYIKALRKEKSRIIPYTVKRESADHDSAIQKSSMIQSASAIRDKIMLFDDSAFDYVPKSTKSVLENAKREGRLPSNFEKLDTAIISSLRLNSPSNTIDIHDAAGGLYNRLCTVSAKVTSISSLMSETETKKYTRARIRRAILNTYFGVTSSDVRTLPVYTQVLAMDTVGMSLLKRIKKATDFPVITKPSSFKDYSADVIRQATLSHKADSIYGLTFDSPYQGNFPLTFTPYVKK